MKELILTGLDLLLPERVRAGAGDWRAPLDGGIHRPMYHFRPPRNWMNDPNGLSQFNGEYHLFFQYNPYGNRLNNISWGHAKSPDMIHWEILPLALQPGEKYDRFGTWSGCVVIHEGTAHALYTGVSTRVCYPQHQCLATSRDMITWRKHPQAIIPAPPPGMHIMDFRDPYVWRHGDRWLMAIAAGYSGNGAVLLYSADDLAKWRYEGILHQGRNREYGRVWECPSFFAIDNRWYLVISLMAGRTGYFAGTFDGKKFTPEFFERLDMGNSMYAPQAFTDDSGRIVMFSWLKENRSDAHSYGWQGVQTLPRVITAAPDGRLLFAPAAETASLRLDTIEAPSATASFRTIFTPGGSQYEVTATFDPCGASAAGLTILQSPDGSEKTHIMYDATTSQLTVDRSQSSLSSTPEKTPLAMPLATRGGDIQMRIFADRSVVEVFAGPPGSAHRACLSFRVYPSCAAGPSQISFTTRGGPATLRSAILHHLASVWPA